MKTCVVCGKEYQENYSNQQVCKRCYRILTFSGRPDGLITDIEKRESTIRTTWAEQAKKKNDRIVGVGYAQRQIADTLSKVEKIDTEL